MFPEDETDAEPKKLVTVPVAVPDEKPKPPFAPM
jgi:hypothetical protein